MSRASRLLGAAALGLALASSAAGVGLVERSFLSLAPAPLEYVPAGIASDTCSGVAARGDGLVAVAGWTRHSVFLVDARDPSAMRLICELAVGGVTPVEVSGMAFDGNTLYIGGDDSSADVNGLWRTTLPANPFMNCPPPPTAMAAVQSGVTPNVFQVGGTTYIFICNQWGFANQVIDVAANRSVGTWTPADPTGLNPVKVADAHVQTLSDGRVLAVVPGLRSGCYLVDLSTPAQPRTLAHWDWTYKPPDFDGDPTTVDGCDRNGDGDTLDCGEMGRNGDHVRLNFCSYATIAEAGGHPYVITVDASLGGPVRVWSLDDAIATCPGDSTCPDDRLLTTASGPPWPGVDILPPVADLQLLECPLAPANVSVQGTLLLVAYHDEGVQAVDLDAQNLPASAATQPQHLTVLASYDTLPGNTDTVLENFPCHPVGQDDGCESPVSNWPPTPCQSNPPAGAAFRVVRNPGLWSAQQAILSACHVLIADLGSPDADGGETHQGTQPGLWALDFTPYPGEIGGKLRVAKDVSDTTAVQLIWSASAVGASEYHVHRGTLPRVAPFAYDHQCVLRTPSSTGVSLPGQIDSAGPSYYYLVSATCSGEEGTLGQDSFGREIAPGANPCP